MVCQRTEEVVLYKISKRCISRFKSNWWHRQILWIKNYSYIYITQDIHCTFTSGINAEILAVGGGGGGGQHNAGGGGAGGLQYRNNAPVSAQAYSITVGTGGAGGSGGTYDVGDNGTSTTTAGITTTAYGGGGGGANNPAPVVGNGGSGGGEFDGQVQWIKSGLKVENTNLHQDKEMMVEHQIRLLLVVEVVLDSWRCYHSNKRGGYGGTGLIYDISGESRWYAGGGGGGGN